MMTLNNENPFQTTAKTSSSSPYLEFTILLYKYGLPYLPYLPQNFLSKIFCLEKVWTCVQTFLVLFLGLSPQVIDSPSLFNPPISGFFQFVYIRLLSPFFNNLPTFCQKQAINFPKVYISFACFQLELKGVHFFAHFELEVQTTTQLLT